MESDVSAIKGTNHIEPIITEQDFMVVEEEIKLYSILYGE